MSKSKIHLEKIEQNGWVSGIYKGHKFQAKVYDEPSIYGIDGDLLSI